MAFFQKTVNLKKLILYIGAPLLGAGLSSLIARPSFNDLVQPPLSPPAWVFPIVWTILYILMGYAAYRIASSTDGNKSGALHTWWTQLGVNLLWPIAFFGLGWRLFAFFWLLLLIVLIGRTILRFRAIDRLAATLLYPYLAWCAFAAYLNLGFYLLNR